MTSNTKCSLMTYPAYFVTTLVTLHYAGIGWMFVVSLCCLWIDVVSWVMSRKATSVPERKEVR